MSLWWAKREQLDERQVDLIENLPHLQDHLITGPPGSGKTNVLLRRAQFVRRQGFPKVKVLSFTRALTEFVKTGCFDASGREIFPPALVTTVESFIRDIYDSYEADVPDNQDFDIRKAQIAVGALELLSDGKIPKYEVIFVDEAQDLIPEEVELLREAADNLFFVGDSRQKIYGGTNGLSEIGKFIGNNSHELDFHYRICPEICEVADRILIPTGGKSLLSTQHYKGPTPGSVADHGPLSRDEQMDLAADILAAQIRVYADLIDQGDLIGIVVPRKTDRQAILAHLESDPRLAARAQIVRARSGEDGDGHNPALDPSRPICILTTVGVKGLEFRALHWLFSDELQQYNTAERYYTVVTRAKTSLDFYFSTQLPATLAQAYASTEGDMW